MKTLRVICALFWLGCGWCAGDAACQNTRRHLAALEKTLLLLQRVRQEISYRHTDLTLLFRRLKQEGLAFYQERFTLFLQQAQEHARPQLELSHKLGFAAGLAAAILCL